MQRTSVHRSVWPAAMAVVLALCAAALAVGGIWLVTLGGSAYYVIAAVALAASGWLLWRRKPAALWVYAALLVGTMVWAIAEVGFDFWQLVPRGDILVLLGILLALPWVARPLSAANRWPGAAWPLLGTVGLAVIVAGTALAHNDHDLEGRLPGIRIAATPVDGLLASGDWPAYGGSLRGNRWSPLRQITPANAGRLKPAWRFDTGDQKRPGDPDEFTYEVTPIKIGNLLYLCTPHNLVFALDAETGQQVWKFDPHIGRTSDMQHLTCRGLSYHADQPTGPLKSGGPCMQRIVMGTNDARLIELDALTGQRCPGFGRNGEVNVWPGLPGQKRGWWQITSAPLVTRGLIVFGGAVYDDMSSFMPSGVIRAYDVHTGAPVWAFDPGDPANTAPRGADGRFVPSSPNNWMIGSADEQLGLVYVPMGMAAVDQWGGRRSADTERYASSIIALDLATGQPRWVYQTVHHDLWDMDVPAQPALVDLDLPGRGRVPALVQSTKTGNIFVLDRRTGQPIFPVSERPVPGGAAPGDWVSASQPFSSLSLMPQKRVRAADMWGATMFDQLMCRIRFQGMRYQGPFTPPSLKGTLVFPGNFGVMDWGGMAIDPQRLVAFAHPNYIAYVDRLVPRPSGAGGPQNNRQGAGGGLAPANAKGYNPNTGAPFAALLNPFLSPLGLPCQAPPWGYVAGLDLAAGKVAWKHRNGTIRDESPVPLPFKLGVPSLGGPIVTAGGVAFLGSALDDYLRAYDMETGHVLWKARLSAGGQASPMSYWSQASQRQFVVIAAGGHGTLGTKAGDSIVAYALPRKE
ncbi:MAG TPA: membrane-bound PQQ-dependent dehydrogenase, glucose/quinate/shikimate family [Sphingomonadaceae bacterium]